MSHRHSHSHSHRRNHRDAHRHHCPSCHRPRVGLTADEVFETLTRRLSPGRIALRVGPLRRLAARIGTCDCSFRLFTPPPVAEYLVFALRDSDTAREAA